MKRYNVKEKGVIKKCKGSICNICTMQHNYPDRSAYCGDCPHYKPRGPRRKTIMRELAYALHMQQYVAESRKNWRWFFDQERN